MTSSQKNSGKNEPNEPHSFMAWGGVIGGVAGAILGGFIGHWVVWAIFIGTAGLSVGALIDRSRR